MIIHRNTVTPVARLDILAYPLIEVYFMNTALVIIDMQQSLIDNQPAAVGTLLDHTLLLIQNARSANVPVIFE